MILSGKKLVVYKAKRILDMVAMMATVFIGTFLLISIAIGA